MFLPKNGLLNWYSYMIFFWKNSLDFWHWKLTLEIQFWHFLTKFNTSKESFKNNFLWVCRFLAKILLFRTHHLWNSTTELIFSSSLLVSHSFSYLQHTKLKVPSQHTKSMSFFAIAMHSSCRQFIMQKNSGTEGSMVSYWKKYNPALFEWNWVWLAVLLVDPIISF